MSSQKDKHPLLTSIENPIHRFCDDFASCIDDESFARAKLGPQTTNPNPRLTEYKDYEIVSFIGQGATANVYGGRKKGTPFMYAIKKYKPNADSNFQEFEIASKLNHPNCLAIVDHLTWEDDSHVVVMPLAPGGSLSLSTVPQMTVSNAVMFLDQIGSALAHMHAQDIVHRDVKPDNILLFDDGFRICDYSMAKQLKRPDESLVGVVGTSVFMAPEISNEVAYAPKPADMWAVGITVYGLLYGQLPWTLARIATQNVPNVQNAARNEVRGSLTFPNIPRVPDGLKEIICQLLVINPQDRLTAQGLCEDPWIQEQREQWRDVIAFISGERKGGVFL